MKEMQEHEHHGHGHGEGDHHDAHGNDHHTTKVDPEEKYLNGLHDTEKI